MISMLLRSDDSRFTVVVPRSRIRDLVARCTQAGQLETGGVLVGAYSKDGECATVIAIGAPPVDSASGHTWFRRGIRGVSEWLSALWRGSTPVYYLGEWHFHPFANPNASVEDVEQIRGIAQDERYRCPEPVLIIVGGDPKAKWRLAAYVATKREVVPLHER